MTFGRTRTVSSSNNGLGKALQNKLLSKRTILPAYEKKETPTSIIEEKSLDEFINTAKLADQDFETLRSKEIRIVNKELEYETLLKKADEFSEKTESLKEFLRIPKRPAWDANTTPKELDKLERESFLVWRRQLAEIQKDSDLVPSPFEKNIYVWRQLWRVIERSDLVVQIIDARNPLFFRCQDLEDYVNLLNKANLLLINKSDLLTIAQRKLWADFFKSQNIQFAFYSAKLALEQATSSNTIDKSLVEIVSVSELERLFKSIVRKENITVGLVGYPNVGKSSTINTILGEKKVSVSATPGKTKHFQTIKISDSTTLCDCPGLVFPNYSFTKADLLLNGVLLIDQMRDYREPIRLLTLRIPKHVIEKEYSIKLQGNSTINSQVTYDEDELLNTYAKSRGYFTSGYGNPDQARAARYILKDYCAGKLLYCYPCANISSKMFNLYAKDDLPNMTNQEFQNITNQKINMNDDDLPKADDRSQGYILVRPNGQRRDYNSHKKHGKGKKFHRNI